MPTGALSQVAFQMPQVPDWVTSVDIYAVVSNLHTSTGDISWSAYLTEGGDGDDLDNTTALATTQAHTVPAQDVRDEILLAAGQAVTPGDLVTVTFRRTTSGDTLGGALGLHRVEFRAPSA